MTILGEEIARKLKATADNFGPNELDGAVIICGEYMDGRVRMCGLEYIDAPTFASPTLGRVRYDVARFFEDI